MEYSLDGSLPPHQPREQNCALHSGRSPTRPQEPPLRQAKKEARAKCVALEQKDTTVALATARATEEELDAQEELAMLLRATAKEVRTSG